MEYLQRYALHAPLKVAEATRGQLGQVGIALGKLLSFGFHLIVNAMGK